MFRGLEHTAHKKPLKEMGFFNLEKTKGEYNRSLLQTEGRAGGAIEKADSSQRHTAQGQEAMDRRCSKENSC